MDRDGYAAINNGGICRTLWLASNFLRKYNIAGMYLDIPVIVYQVYVI